MSTPKTKINHSRHRPRITTLLSVFSVIRPQSGLIMIWTWWFLNRKAIVEFSWNSHLFWCYREYTFPIHCPIAQIGSMTFPIQILDIHWFIEIPYSAILNVNCIKMKLKTMIILYFDRSLRVFSRSTHGSRFELQSWTTRNTLSIICSIKKSI